MKVKKEELKLGDIFRTEYKGAEIYNKVVDIADTPVYDPTTFEFEILYRETPEIRTALSETIKSTK